MRKPISMQLKELYSNLDMLSQIAKDLEYEKIKTDNLLKTIKRDIRQLHKISAPIDDKFRAYANDEMGGFDRCYCKYELPYIMSDEEVDKFIEDEWCHWYNPWDDGRDCTGVWFTTRIRVIPIPQMNKTIVIHCKSCDV